MFLLALHFVSRNIQIKGTFFFLEAAGSVICCNFILSPYFPFGMYQIKTQKTAFVGLERLFPASMNTHIHTHTHVPETMLRRQWYWATNGGETGLRFILHSPFSILHLCSIMHRDFLLLSSPLKLGSVVYFYTTVFNTNRALRPPNGQCTRIFVDERIWSKKQHQKPKKHID